MSSKTPFFLIAAERSGTTLLRLMLDGHPEVSWLNEFEYSVDCIRSSDSWPDLEEYGKWLETHRIFQSSGLMVRKDLDYPSLMQDFLDQKTLPETTVTGATCHRHYDRLLRLFPGAKLIYMYRDPRDVARSNIGMGWAGNVWFGVDRWIEAEELWGRLKKSLDEKRYLEICYEDLIANAEQELHELAAFLGLSYHPGMLSYPDYTSYSVPDPGLVGQWKKKAGQKEISLIEYKAEKSMKTRGYQLANSPCRPPSPMEKIWLALENRYKRIRFRQKRFGFLLFSAEFIARRLKIQALAKKLKLRMNEVEKLHLK